MQTKYKNKKAYLQSLNNNIRCTEIQLKAILFLVIRILNNNIRCIEINNNCVGCVKGGNLNNNIRCIEIAEIMEECSLFCP